MSMQRTIVVGIDGSAGAQAAVRWALEEAGTWRVAVRLICAYRLMPGFYQAPGMYADYPQDMELVRKNAARVVSEALADAARSAPDVAVSGDTVDGSAGTGAARGVRDGRAAGARVPPALGTRVHLPGVGERRGGGPFELPRRRAARPGGAGRRSRPRWWSGWMAARPPRRCWNSDFDHASRRRAPLRAVLCWHPDLLASMLWRPEPPAPTQAEAWLAETVAGWQEKYPDVAVRTGVVREHPAAGLVAEAATAQLLVVGNRGRHAMAGTLLGSVSQAVLHTALCPVAVIPTQSL